MRNRIYRIPLLSLLLSFIFIGTLIPTETYAATKAKVPAFTYTRLFYYQDGAAARKSFLTHPNSIDIFAPQSYGFNDTGQLVGSVYSAVKE